MNLQSLVRFAAVVEHGGFSPAARALDLPRQSLHRAVEQLEEEIGLRLLDRSTRGVRATHTGRRLYEQARRVREAALDADAVVVAARERPQGLLRIAAPPLFARLELGTVIERFLRRWPEVHIEADLSHTPVQLHDDDLDLAIRVFVPPPPDAIARRIGTGTLLCVASPAYLAEHGTPAHPEALARHARVCFGPRAVGVQWTFRKGDHTVHVSSEGSRLRIDDYDVVTDAVVSGLGVGVLPSMLCGPHLREGRLVRILDGWTHEEAPIWAIYAGRARGNPTLHAFLEMLEAHMAEVRRAMEREG